MPTNTPAEPISLAPAPADMLAVMQSRVTAKLEGNQDVLKALDPSVWLGIFAAVIELFRECRKNATKEKVVASMKNPTFAQRVKLRRGLIKEIGRSKLRSFDSPVVESIAATAKDSTDAELDAFYEQVKQ